VYIVCIGNEVLFGDVLDSNSNWICKAVTGLGAFVQHISTIRDDIDAISEEILLARGKGAKAIFTIGGLGPTVDDLTLSGVSKAIGRPLVLNEEARTMVESRYRDLARSGYVSSPTMTAEREKMAFLPEGSRPMNNSVGTAPGVVTEYFNSTIVCLPGVPDELKMIFTESLRDTLQRTIGKGLYLERVVSANTADESRIAPVLTNQVRLHPSVYIKSRAKRFGSDVRIRITVSASGNSSDEVSAQVDQALADIEKALLIVGITTSREEPAD
jgi:molybdopterin-biosynthesis enzyme MoeA-like protein